MRGKLLVLLLGWNILMQAQDDPVAQAVAYLVEFNQAEGESIDLVQVAEQLSYLQNNPVAINSATADELMEIPLFNSFMAFNLLEYRKRTGRILSYYQLSDIKGFTPQFIELIEPFTTLEYVIEQALFPKHFTHELTLRYRQYTRGYEVIGDGHPSENYVRYRMQAEGRLFAGATFQRDPGEAWLPNSYAPDFSSFHLEYRTRGLLKTIVLGDYSASFGQGLTLWSRLAFNKNGNATNVARFGNGLRYYSGTDENRFLRGIGLEFRHKQLAFYPFFSAKSSDANLVQTDYGITAATSLQTSGFHRTEAEIADKNSLPIRLAGLYTVWQPTRLKLGFLATKTDFSYPIEPNNTPENAFRFRGKNLMHTALDWKYSYGRLFFFGETSIEWQTKLQATTAGLQVQADDALQWVVQFRHLPVGWFALYNAPFAETSRDGETGMYLGLNWQLPKNLSLAFFADYFKYTWLRTTLNRPAQGSDYMAQLNWLPRNISGYLRMRYQIRPQNLPLDQTTKPASDAKRLSLRAHANLPILRQLKLQTRAEWVRYQQIGLPAEYGLLTYLGAQWQISEKWQLKTRYTLFDTESYDAAIWAYEDDVPFSFSVPAFYQNGTKWYALLAWQATAHTEFWLRWADANTLQNALQTESRSDIRLVWRQAF